VLAGILSVRFGGALAAGLIRQVGALIAVGLRLDFAALILLVATRPRIHGRTRAVWLAAGLLGLALGAPSQGHRAQEGSLRSSISQAWSIACQAIRRAA
jgi:threonine/homoserine efflux transporter RhtA